MHVVAYVYMYSFCCWFIYAVLMCFVAIVEEAFFAARCVHPRMHPWAALADGPRAQTPRTRA